MARAQGVFLGFTLCGLTVEQTILNISATNAAAVNAKAIKPPETPAEPANACIDNSERPIARALSPHN
jgi:hypothetical protein